MASYYGNAGYAGNQQQQGGTDSSGFYSSNYGQQQQQPQAPPPQAFQHSSAATNNNATQQWTAPQPQQQTTAQSTTQQQQQAPAFWNPGAAATVMSSVATGGGLTNDAMFDLAATTGKNFLQSGSARMIPGLEGLFQNLRKYFAVDNRYVKRKMTKLLFPFLNKQWKRQKAEFDNSNSQELALPTSDENAPDLYLPCMSLITYVLLCALCYGNAGQFSPEVIPNVTSTCVVCQILEVLLIRFVFYMMQAPVSFLDLFAYTGYMYLGLCVNMLIGLGLSALQFGHRGYYAMFLYTASACSYWMLKTMANNIPIVTASNGPRREVAVVGFAALQFLAMWLCSQTKFL